MSCHFYDCFIFYVTGQKEGKWTGRQRDFTLKLSRTTSNTEQYQIQIKQRSCFFLT